MPEWSAVQVFTLGSGPVKRRLAMIGVFAFAFIGAVYLLTDVDTRLKPQDLAAIRSLEIKKDCEDLTTFAKELGCVRSLQAAIQDKIPDLRCATKDKTIEPKEFLQRGYGCCYDRARIIEKSLTFYGFEVRHFSLHDLRIPILGYLLPADSHAATDVKTSKGWMYVDSNYPFVLVSKSNEPVTIQMLRRMDWANLQDQPVQKKFFRKEPRIFYGLYSRHGFFYPPKVPLPDIDWSQILHNLYGG